MAHYKYVATDPFGSQVTGKIEANNEQEVRVYLRTSNLTPAKITRSWIRADVTIGAGFKLKDIIVFTRMFSAMIKAAISVDQALKVLFEQTTNPVIKRAIQRLIVDIESGLSLSEAMAKQPKVFDTIYVNMVGAGEVSGNMETLLDRLSDVLERTAAIKAKVKGAMIYPIALLLVAVASVSLLLTFVLPQFVETFEDANVALPLPTRISIGASHVLTGYWWAILLGIGAIVALLKYLNRFPGYIFFRDRAFLKMKVIGDLVTKAAVARFTRTFATLVSSGVPIMDGLELTAQTAGNVVISGAILDARTAIASGSEIAEPLKTSGVFPPLCTAMIAIGEQSGQLDMMLEKIADFYEVEVHTAVDGALKLIEPIMLVVLGGLVGLVMTSLYLPMFDMISVIGNN